MFVFRNGRAVLFGLVSFGVTCADNYPGVFTSVSSYLEWIQNVMIAYDGEMSFREDNHQNHHHRNRMIEKFKLSIYDLNNKINN